MIGVNETGGLSPLGGAVSGAKEFAEWAGSQGVPSTLVTDEDQPVTLTQIQDAVESILEPRNCKKLIIYFAGHGFLLSPNVELWFCAAQSS